MTSDVCDFHIICYERVRARVCLARNRELAGDYAYYIGTITESPHAFVST